MVAPAAPEPQTAVHPPPRVLWADQESGRLQLIAHDWEDGHPPSYGVLARHGRQWQPATGEEVWATLVALARWIDARAGELELERRGQCESDPL